MKLNDSLKRTGVVLIIFSIILFLIIAFIRMMAEPQIVSYHMSGGQTLQIKRGITENMVLHWIETALIIFPIFACGVILLLGNGARLINWIKNGSSRSDDDADRKNPDNT